MTFSHNQKTINSPMGLTIMLSLTLNPCTHFEGLAQLLPQAPIELAKKVPIYA